MVIKHAQHLYKELWRILSNIVKPNPMKIYLTFLSLSLHHLLDFDLPLSLSSSYLTDGLFKFWKKFGYSLEILFDWQYSLLNYWTVVNISLDDKNIYNKFFFFLKKRKRYKKEVKPCPIPKDSGQTTPEQFLSPPMSW